MKKTFLNLAALSLSLFLFLSGCDNTEETKLPSLLDNGQYTVGVKIGSLETRGKIFYDEEGFLHFLHEDPTSPLFGMEEVFENGTVKSYYKDLEYESGNVGYGTGVLKEIFDTLKDDEPERAEKSNDENTSFFEKSSLSFTLVTKAEDHTPIRISGTGKDIPFEINFNESA